MEQIALAIFGVSAIWLSQDKDTNKRKYAPLLGMCSQPFWFYSAYNAEQWGIFILCMFYTVSWGKGIKTYWWKT